MLLSIIVPVYNVGKYLNECLNTVIALRQSLEIILVDDGSTDGSGILCDEWAEKDSRIRVIHQSNVGLSGARNTGIRQSKGDYLMFLDSDDFLNVGETERLLSHLDSRYDVIVGLYENYYETQNKSEKEYGQTFLENTGEITKDRFLETISMVEEGCYLVAVRFIVRKDFLMDNEYFFCEGIYHEDEEWVSRWLKTAQRIYLSDCYFYKYRQSREDSIMAMVKPKHIWDSLTIMEHDKELLLKEQVGTVYAEFLQIRMARLFLNVLLNMSVLNKQERKQAIGKLRALYPFYVKGLKGKKAKLVKVFCWAFGIRFTGVMLRAIKRIK